MDELAGISWSSTPASTAPKPKPPPPKPSPFTGASINLPVRPGPLSSRTASPSIPTTTTTTTAGAGTDSFAGLVSFGRSKQAAENLSLQEQQRRLQEQRAREEQQRRDKIDAVFGSAGGGFWDSLETGKGGAPQPRGRDEEEEDILAAFSASVPVDNSSHYPPPTATATATVGGSSSYSTPRSGTPGGGAASSSHLQDLMGSPGLGYRSSEPVLDPFDIANLPSTTTTTSNNTDDDFDILGDLAKPVSELPPRRDPAPPPPPNPQIVVPPKSPDPRDPVIAEIMEMGFTAAQAKRALAETGSLDVTTAVGWLLEEAHRKTRAAPSPQPISRSVSEQGQRGRRRDQEEGGDHPGVPAWARDRSRESGGEKDIGALAQEIGGNLFKSANTLWNTGRKKVEKAIAELQAEGEGGEGADPNVPKWMRDQQMEASTVPRARETADMPARSSRFDDGEDMMRPSPRATQRAQKAAPIEPALTEEAMMLEAGSGPPPRRKKQEREREPPSPFQQQQQRSPSEKEIAQRQRQLAFEQAVRDKEREMRERERRQSSGIPNSSERNRKLTREAVDEDSSVQYVSRNRRRPPPPAAPRPAAAAAAAPEPPQGDLLFSSAREQSRNPYHQQQPTRSPAPAPTYAPPPRRTPPPRPTVPLSPSAAAASSASRADGTAAFKRGDYTLALTHYTRALAPLPDPHPLRITALSNRALCNLKLGDPRAALADCDSALTIIGPARGEGETIPGDDGTAAKDMKELWGKTTTRRAEALEQLEKWADALAAWTTAVEANVGGAAAAAGRRRCEAATTPQPPPAPKPRPKPRPAARPRPTDATAVKALRRANAAADRVEDEKLALHDSVAARIGAWKAGKEGNLRALLASLDTVLWEGAGWRRVGMGELLVPARCKVAYMKGIAKVHPDKIAQDATTEQRMISAAVFSLLNEAWDGFKAENGL